MFKGKNVRKNRVIIEIFPSITASLEGKEGWEYEVLLDGKGGHGHFNTLFYSPTEFAALTLATAKAETLISELGSEKGENAKIAAPKIVFYETLYDFFLTQQNRQNTSQRKVRT